VKSKEKTRTSARSMRKLQKARFEALNASKFRCIDILWKKCGLLYT